MGTLHLAGTEVTADVVGLGVELRIAPLDFLSGDTLRVDTNLEGAHLVEGDGVSQTELFFHLLEDALENDGHFRLLDT